jgi:hypothetical protein
MQRTLQACSPQSYCGMVASIITLCASLRLKVDRSSASHVCRTQLMCSALGRCRANHSHQPVPATWNSSDGPLQREVSWCIHSFGRPRCTSATPSSLVLRLQHPSPEMDGLHGCMDDSGRVWGLSRSAYHEIRACLFCCIPLISRHKALILRSGVETL